MTNLSAVLLALLLQGEPPAPVAIEARAVSYLHRLRDERTRDRARDRLVHLGRAALPWIESADLDPALRRSLQEEIAFNESLGGSYGPPHLFSFDGREETLGTLLTRLEAEAGVPFQRNSLDLSQRIPLRLDEAGFWEALDEVCKAASIWYYPASDVLYLNGGMPSAKPRSYYGPTMIVLDRVVQQRRVGFDKSETDLTLHLMCVWERHLTALGLTYRYQLRRVLDDQGVPLIPDAVSRTAPPRPAQLVRSQGQMLPIPGLKPPSPAARKLAVVEGTLEVEFPARLDELRFPNPAENLPAKSDVEGASVELRSCTPQASWGVTYEFVVRFQDEKEAAEFRIGAGDLDFITPVGSPRSGWVGSARLEKNTYYFTTHWRNGGRPEMPSEVRVRLPRGSLIKHVPFRFQDVVLK